MDIQEFLRSIRTPKGYKRVNISPIRYAGGKSKAIGMILENMPALREKKIVSPFLGGGSVELVFAKVLGFQVVAYDVFAILVNFWNQLLNHPTDLADELAKLRPSKDEYTRNRHILLEYWEKVKPPTLTYRTKNRLELTPEEKTRLDASPLLQAAYYYYNMQLSYGPMFLGWGSSVYCNQNRYDTIVETLRQFQAPTLRVACASFEAVLEAHTDDFLFLDPPYYLGEDSKMFKGIYPNSNFAIHHNGFCHRDLCDRLKKHRGGFFLTYNDCPTIREWYSDYKQVYPAWQYTYGQGETRIGKNRKDGNTHTKESHEIFIICPPLDDKESGTEEAL